MLIPLLLFLCAEGLVLIILGITLVQHVSSLQPTIHIPPPEKPILTREDVALAVFAAFVAQKRPPDENTLRLAQQVADTLFLPNSPTVPVVDAPSPDALG